MKINEVATRKPGVHAALAYSLIDVMMGVALLGTMMVSLYGGIASGFALTQLARENLRGTQIMLERMEGIRLYNWNQITVSNMVPTNFTSYYYPLAASNNSQGITYWGTLNIDRVASTNLSPAVGYSDSMRAIRVMLVWTNGGYQRIRTMSTLVAKNGIQNYVFTH
jgi:hypothetical protein